MTGLRGRTGFEIELLAPPGRSRRDLADELARRCQGTVRPVWHHDSEPSLVPGLGQFLHLTQGFEVRRPDSALLCTLVDDITLLADLDPRAAPVPGWYRVLTDDQRLLELLARHADPAEPLEAVLDPVAELWDEHVRPHGPVRRLSVAGTTVALAAPQGAGRERPCELVTPPLVDDHRAALEQLLEPARALGFTVPVEAAVHVHVDGAPFREAGVLANVIRLFGHWREPLRTLLGTNPACRRLAPLPPSLVAAADGRPAREGLQAAAAGLTKFFDVNLTQLLRDDPQRDTLEVRVLPGALHADDVLRGAVVVERLLDRCRQPEPVPLPPAAGAVRALRELAEGAADGTCD